MRSSTLIRQNIRWFQRFWRLVAVATALAVAVIAGSLIVGDSVRHSLEQRVLDRLGDTRSVILSGSGYLDAGMVAGSPDARGVLMSDGFVSVGGRLIPVTVWGVDDIAPGKVAVNQPLSREAGIAEGEFLVLRLPHNGLVPSGSLFVTEAYSASLRLACAEIRSAAQGGNLSLRNGQVLPYNVFVSRSELCETLETGDKINLVLSPHIMDNQDLEASFDPAFAGLSLREAPDGSYEVISDAVFLRDPVLQTLRASDPEPNRLFSYLANSIRLDEEAIPYSFITALDTYDGEPVPDDEIYLTDYTARRLGARIGDRITVNYYVSPGMKQLRTDSVSLYVGKILPIADILADPGLSADFPGLTDSQRCSDWDSDLPIDMSRITDEDERYWELYRAAPKAILPYSAVAHAWSNPFGSATALRLMDEPDFSVLSPADFGVSVIQPFESGLAAARGGVDFGGLFLALGCFIIFAALLLILNPLTEMIAARRAELDLLSSLGYPQKRIGRLLAREAVPVVGIAALIGLLIGLLYAFGVLFLLGNLWKGATHTDGFTMYPSLPTLLISLAAGILLAAGTIAWALRRSLHPRPAKAQKANTGRARIWALVCLGLLVVLPFTARWLGAVVTFVLVGCCWVAAGTLLLADWLSRKPQATAERKSLVRESLHASRGRVLLSFVTLTLGVFIVFAVGLNRQDFSDATKFPTGTGGYDWWCETSVPIYYALTLPESQRHLALNDLAPEAEILQFFRAAGDDASCLNLNKVETPAVLGVDMETFLRNFPVKDLTANDLRSGRKALVDETVLLWGMMKQVGDTLHYQDNQGRPVDIEIAGTLPNTIFQGNILIDRTIFAEAWPESTGSEVFLLRSSEQQDAQTVAAALNEYGIRMMRTTERLRQFNSVTDTYLTIFFMLGAIGLLLGLVSFFVIVRKNLAARRPDLEQCAVLGIGKQTAEDLLLRELRPVPLAAIGLGVTGALVSILASFGSVPLLIWILTAVVTALLLALVSLAVSRAIRKACSEVYDVGDPTAENPMKRTDR